MCDRLDAYLAGDRLYGDDFTLEEIETWFKDEEEAYANLGAKDRGAYRYGYHALNRRHGYRHILKRRLGQVLGLGSAYGEELLPVLERIEHITILDPSDAFSDLRRIGTVPCDYRKPNMNGSMPFRSGQFDLITCLGVMHHIPNVSAVMKECHRCLASDGVMLIREPIVSMGDWTRPRPGLTKRERGIPIDIFHRIIGDSGFRIRHKALCIFPPLPRLAAKLNIGVYRNYGLTALDALLCRIFSRNLTYHRTGIWSKFGPSSAYFVLEKRNS